MKATKNPHNLNRSIAVIKLHFDGKFLGSFILNYKLHCNVFFVVLNVTFSFLLLSLVFNFCYTIQTIKMMKNDRKRTRGLFIYLANEHTMCILKNAFKIQVYLQSIS